MEEKRGLLGNVERVGELVRPGGVVQQPLGLAGVKDAALLPVPDALDAGHRKAPFVFQVAAEQRGGRKLVVGVLRENAGGGQLQPRKAVGLHLGVDGLVVGFVPGDV